MASLPRANKNNYGMSSIVHYNYYTYITEFAKRIVSDFHGREVDRLPHPVTPEVR